MSLATKSQLDLFSETDLKLRSSACIESAKWYMKACMSSSELFNMLWASTNVSFSIYWSSYARCDRSFSILGMIERMVRLTKTSLNISCLSICVMDLSDVLFVQQLFKTNLCQYESA